MSQKSTHLLYQNTQIVSEPLQLLKIDKDQRVAAMMPVDDFMGDYNLLLLTKHGYLKQVQLSDFKAQRPGSSAIKLVSPLQHCSARCLRALHLCYLMPIA